MRQKVAIIGNNPEAAEWVARFLLMGWDVALTKPTPANLEGVLLRARRTLPGLYDICLPDEGELVQRASLAKAVAGADWVVEAGQGGLSERQRLYRYIHAISPTAVIATTTADISLDELQQGAPEPGRILAVLGCSPIYLLPMVEILTTPENTAQVIAQARAVMADIGLSPVFSTGPVTKLVANSVLRQAQDMIDAGKANEDEIDNVIRYGLGLVWATLGPFRYKSSLAKWATPVNHRQRDNSLVAVLRALKKPFDPKSAFAAGVVLQELEQTKKPPKPKEHTGPIETYNCAVPVDWVDYNGHMTEACYLKAFAHATDQFMAIIGCDANYIQTGKSFFTVETHIRHLQEVQAEEKITVSTQLLAAEGKKMHLWHQLSVNDALKATSEHMLVHVDLETRNAISPEPEIQNQLSEIWSIHKSLPQPEGAGRFVGEARNK